MAYRAVKGKRFLFLFGQIPVNQYMAELGSFCIYCTQKVVGNVVTECANCIFHEGGETIGTLSYVK